MGLGAIPVSQRGVAAVDELVADRSEKLARAERVGDGPLANGCDRFAARPA